jgi:hypothetical protein
VNTIQDKLEEFTAAILHEATMGSKEIMDKLDRERESAIASIQSEIE